MYAISRTSRFILIVAVISISACTTTIERPPAMTLNEAITEVVDTLDHISKTRPQNTIGLIPSEVVVEFALQVGEKDTNSRTLEVIPVGIIKEISKLSGTWSSEVTSGSSNKISIKFSNLLLAPKSSIVGSVEPNELEKMISDLQKLGFPIWVQ